MYYVYKYIGKNDELLYVGQTIDLDRRFNEHKGREWDLEKEKILFAECKTISDMNLYEMYYINKLCPKYNTALVFNDRPSFDIPELIWNEYDKNHFETSQKEVRDKFRNSFTERFDPVNYWSNKISLLKKEFDDETDFLKKKEILIKISEYENKLNALK